MVQAGEREAAEVSHATRAELETGIEHIRGAPADHGTVVLIVARPAPGERTVLDRASFDLVEGTVGDSWRTRGNRHTPDGSADPLAQVTLMSARAALLFARTEARRQLSGDQLVVDLDLSGENLPAGTRIALGSAVLEITPKPHTGCAKFAARFGADALRFVGSDVGHELRLRGVNAAVVVAGSVCTGAAIRKLLP